MIQRADRADPPHWYGAEHLVRRSGDGSFGDRRLTEQDLFNFCGMHQLAPTVDHVVAAPGEKEVPVAAETPKITSI
ncbi:MAG: hypothetical protein M3300_02810 [Actinomycetota bacterium]|nr:hypothetical protein [Actinomycetota bacterium]